MSWNKKGWCEYFKEIILKRIGLQTQKAPKEFGVSFKITDQKWKPCRIQKRSMLHSCFNFKYCYITAVEAGMLFLSVQTRRGFCLGLYLLLLYFCLSGLLLQEKKFTLVYIWCRLKQLRVTFDLVLLFNSLAAPEGIEYIVRQYEQFMT